MCAKESATSSHQHIALLTLVVDDYDTAIAFYVEQMGFELTANTPLDVPGKRWVVVTPPGGTTGLLLAKATNDEQRARVGDQTGGRVALFLHTDNFWRDHARMRRQGITFLETPREESYGTVAVFEDLYGNRWDLLQPT